MKNTRKQLAGKTILGVTLGLSVALSGSMLIPAQTVHANAAAHRFGEAMDHYNSTFDKSNASEGRHNAIDWRYNRNEGHNNSRHDADGTKSNVTAGSSTTNGATPDAAVGRADTNGATPDAAVGSADTNEATPGAAVGSADTNGATPGAAAGSADTNEATPGAAVGSADTNGATSDADVESSNPDEENYDATLEDSAEDTQRLNAITQDFSAAAKAKTSATVDKSSVASNVIATGMKYLGVPYKFGAKAGVTTEFDCSSFVQYVFKKNGISLPRNSREQSKAGKYVSKKNLQAGDLIFADTNHDGVINHVLIYMGNGKVLHTYKVGIGVTVSNFVGSAWDKTYVTARRVI